MDMAAMTSDEQRSELIKKHSCTLRFIVYSPLQYQIRYFFNVLLRGVHLEGMRLYEPICEAAEDKEGHNGAKYAKHKDVAYVVKEALAAHVEARSEYDRR